MNNLFPSDTHSFQDLCHAFLTPIKRTQTPILIIHHPKIKNQKLIEDMDNKLNGRVLTNFKETFKKFGNSCSHFKKAIHNCCFIDNSPQFCSSVPSMQSTLPSQTADTGIHFGGFLHLNCPPMHS